MVMFQPSRKEKNKSRIKFHDKRKNRENRKNEKKTDVVCIIDYYYDFCIYASWL